MPCCQMSLHYHFVFGCDPFRIGRIIGLKTGGIATQPPATHVEDASGIAQKISKLHLRKGTWAFRPPWCRMWARCPRSRGGGASAFLPGYRTRLECCAVRPRAAPYLCDIRCYFRSCFTAKLAMLRDVFLSAGLLRLEGRSCLNF